VRFTNHHSGSLPCIPARHDLLVGAWDFLWKPWGSIDLWEEPITKSLRRNGVVTQLITDHPHLFETGGENYHTEFSAWDYLRGHEGDPWKTVADSSWIGAPSFGRGHTNYDNSRGWFSGESDFPGPGTMTAAANWLEKSAPEVAAPTRGKTRPLFYAPITATTSARTTPARSTCGVNRRYWCTKPWATSRCASPGPAFRCARAEFDPAN